MVDQKGAIDGDEMDDCEESISISKNTPVTSSSASSSLACEFADTAAPELPWDVECRDDADMMAIKGIDK